MVLLSLARSVWTASHIRAIADRRMQGLGLDAPYQVEKNPLPWLAGPHPQRGRTCQLLRASSDRVCEGCLDGIVGRRLGASPGVASSEGVGMNWHIEDDVPGANIGCRAIAKAKPDTHPPHVW